jgi:hypothetical protein
MSVIFPDLEKHLVSYLQTALTSRGEVVHVGTIKTPPGATQPTKEVVLTGSYGQTLDEVRRDASLVIEVYANTYESASSLALLVSALIVRCPGELVKRAVVTLGPVRLGDEGPQEVRSITVDLIVKGTNF